MQLKVANIETLESGHLGSWESRVNVEWLEGLDDVGAYHGETTKRSLVKDTDV